MKTANGSTVTPRSRNSTAARSAARKAVPSSIRAELADLSERDNWRNFLYLGADWLLIGASVVGTLAAGGHPAAYFVAVVVIGSRQRALMNLVHQASHRKLFASRLLNDSVGKFLAGFPLLTSLSGYASAHWRHHGFLWEEERDPKLARYRRLALVEPFAHGASAFRLRHLVGPLLLWHVPFNVAAALALVGEPRSETPPARRVLGARRSRDRAGRSRS